MKFFVWLPQFLYLILFHLHFQVTCSSSPVSNSPLSHVICPLEQSHALLGFKNSVSIFNSYFLLEYPAYPKTESWKEGTDCCLWDGVICDIETGYVIGLDLFHSMLYGTIHSNNTLFMLSHLQKLDLSYNDFSGSHISPQFGHLLYLTRLNLSSSYFEGPVPSEISHLSNLVALDLSGNSLTLETATFNKLVGNLTKLTELSLNEVDMSMVAPASFMNLSSSLSTLKLGSCGLQKNFIEYIHLANRLISIDLSGNYLILDTTAFNKLVRNLTKLSEIDLSNANLSSVAPTSFVNLSSSLSSLTLKSCDGVQEKFLDYIHLPQLVSLDLSYNYDLRLDTISFNMLVRRLPNLRELDLSYVNMSLVAPVSLMNLSSSLSSLKLMNCQLRGEFPGNLLQRPYLKQLELPINEDLTGILPKSNLSSFLQVLALSETKISINLDTNFISNLRSLKMLFLGGCNFTGSNIELLGKLTQLKVLDLSSNNFSGEIPSSFRNLHKLNFLSLASNNFSGRIPNGFSNLTNLLELNLQNNRLTGPIPYHIGNLSMLNYLHLSNNLLTEIIPSSIFSIPSLQYLSLENNQLNRYRSVSVSKQFTVVF